MCHVSNIWKAPHKPHTRLTINTCKGSLADTHVISFCLSCQRRRCDATAITNPPSDMYSYSEPAFESHAEATSASSLWSHGCECYAYVSSLTPLQTHLHQGWTFLCARFLPNNTRIRFDWCKFSDLTFVGNAGMHATITLLWYIYFLVGFFFLFFLGLSVFYCIILKRNCVGSYRLSLDPWQWSVAVVGYGLSHSITYQPT